MTPMNDTDKAEIDKIIRNRKEAHSFFTENSEVYQAFMKMEEKTYRDDKLTKGVKELIAIGISIVINCESCMEWHIKQALDSGMTKEQIIEAIGVGIEMGGGPATVSGRFAAKVLEYYS